ncbi:MAG TPA: hypothetical protein PKA61_07210 [Nitrospira sp.]|nr:hypothetical protein [Nitrospira sp.]
MLSRIPYHRWFLSICAAALLIGGCRGPEYTPEIAVAPARPIIDATAEFHGLYPAQALLSGKQTYGLDAPDAKRQSPTELTVQLEREMLKELAAAGVFSRVTGFDPKPDVVIAGRIDAFHEEYRPRAWTYVPIVDKRLVSRLLNLKSHTSTGEARLTLFVLTPDGNLIGSYKGRSAFHEQFNPTNEVPPGARLNHALSDAVKDIQDQIVRDAQLRQLASRS